MKRKNSVATDLRAFLARAAAKKKRSEQESVGPSSNEREMQLVIFQGQSCSGTPPSPPEQERVEPEPPIIKEDEDNSDSESVHLNDSSDEEEEDDDDIYNIEHDPGLRVPISSYDVNDQDSVRRAYIVLGPCRPKMKREDFPQHKCGDKVLRYEIVFKLLTLVLVLPVATAGVERVFSSMNYIKNKLRPKIGQKFLNGCLVTFIEREFFLQVKDADIITQFQGMKDRKVVL